MTNRFDTKDVPFSRDGFDCYYFFVQSVCLSPIWNELKTTHQVLDVSYICEQVQVQTQECVCSMTTSHQVFDVTVDHLLFLSPETVLNNQVLLQHQV